MDSLRDQTVIVVKAPADTKLEVPDPDEVGENNKITTNFNLAAVMKHNLTFLYLTCSCLNELITNYYYFCFY